MEKNEQFRKLSIAKGLTVPDSCGCIICKGTREPAQELRLASLPAQWPEMRKLEKEFFNALMMEVTEHEKELLRVLKLPTIDTVREYYITDKEDESKPFEYSQPMTALLARVFFKWREDLLGTKRAKIVDEGEAVYPFYMLDSFSMSYNKNFNKLLEALPDYVDKDEFEKKKKRVVNLSNRFLMTAVKSGGERIKTELGKEHLKDIIAELKDMAKNGTGSMTVARKIHNRVGEGKAWYWNRIARSEAALAADAAFSALVKEYQVPYERWEASATPGCDVCAYLDGQVFKADEGPHPVEATHPHCRCLRVPVYITDQPIQQSWNKTRSDSPYDRPYSEEELELMRLGLPPTEENLRLITVFR